MIQPVKKKIKERHPTLVKKEPYRTLLIDGGSLLMMAFKDDKTNSDGVHYGGIFQFLLQIRMMLTKGKFEYVVVVFDQEFSGYLRYQIYPQYKSNRDKHYSDYAPSEYMKTYNENLRRMQNYIFSKSKPSKRLPPEERKKDPWKEFVDANFIREMNILREMFEELFIRCYTDDIVEGDDLISYYCHNKEDNEKIIIMTGDQDIMQLLSDDVCVYYTHHDFKKFITVKNFQENFGYHPKNILTKKILCGDVSDNIANIKGLSEQGLFAMMPAMRTKYVSVEDVRKKAELLIEERKSAKKKPLQVHENIINGVSNKEYISDFYDINDKIINLDNPLLTHEAEEAMQSIMHTPIDPDGRSMANLYEIVTREKLEEIMGESRFASFFAPFKQLEETEKKRYEKYLQENN